MFFKKPQHSSEQGDKTPQISENQQLENWLQYLYRESWQQELLITGITLFLLFQVPDGIEYLEAKLTLVFYESDLIIAGMMIMLGLLKVSSYVLIFNILIDIFLRGLWIGLIGLSSAFPEGIRMEKFKYHPTLKEKILSNITDPKTTIIKLDMLCSIIFSFTFLLIFYLISFGLFISYLLLSVLGIQYADGTTGLLIICILLTIVYISFSLIYFFDFITFGLLRRFKWTAKPYYFIYKFFNYITLAFFYKNIYYTLVSNVKKRYIIPVIFGYLLLTILFLDFQNGNINRGHKDIFHRSFYDNLRTENETIKLASIPQEHIKGNWLKVFIPFNISRKTINHFHQDYEEEDWKVLNRKPIVTTGILKDMLGIYRIKIDNKEIDSLNWLYYKHPNMGEKGFITQANIASYPSGLHTLQVLRPEINKQDSLTYKLSCTIPFWKE